MSPKLLKNLVEVGSEYLRIESGCSIEIWVLAVYVDQFLRRIGDRRGRWSGSEVLSTVSDVEHRCFEILVKGMMLEGVRAPKILTISVTKVYSMGGSTTPAASAILL